jgi:hypothetical protein
MRAVIIMFATLALSGCATKYQDMGFTGGVAAQQMTADTFRIVARGNGYTSATVVQDYVVLKAAETTKTAGGTHFVMIGSGDASTTGTISTPGHAQTTLVGRTAYTTYNPGTVSHYIKPGQDSYIRVVKASPAGQLPTGAIDADEIIKYVGQRVQRDK